MKKIVCLLSVCVLFVSAVFSLVSCSSKEETFEEISSRYANVAQNADLSDKHGTGNAEIIISLGKTAVFNRLVLRETTDSITYFSLRIPGSSSPFYGNDFIGAYRYCSFPAVSTDKLILTLHAEGEWSLGDPEAYYIPTSFAPFSVTSYITAKTAYSLPSNASNPTDVFNIIYSAYLDKDGNVRLPDYFIDDKRIKGETMLSICISNIRSAYPNARVIATVLGDKEFENDGLTLQERYSFAFEKKDFLSSSLLSFINDYALDGISFDYEYPVSDRDYALFADFCAYFAKNLDKEKLFTAAVSAWSIDGKRLNASDLECFDSLTLMAYDDNTDSHGCHSTFYTAFSQLKRLKKQGVHLDKIQLGIPLYSRPLDGSMQSAVYSEYADGLPMFSNTSYAQINGETKACYFNGRQLATDKTSLALDIGLKGVAVWHYGLDSRDPSLSLLHTIYRAIDDK